MLNYLLQIIIVEYLWTSVSRARCHCGSDFLFLKTGTTASRYNKKLLQAHFEKKFCFIYERWVASKQWTSPPWPRVYENQTPLLHNSNILGHSFLVSICQGLPGPLNSGRHPLDCVCTRARHPSLIVISSATVFFVSICQGLPGRKVHLYKKSPEKTPSEWEKKRPNIRVTLMYHLLDRSLRADETNLWLT